MKLFVFLAPENVQKVMVLTQTESSITLTWDKVNNISTYFLKYVNNSIEKEDFINETTEDTSVTNTVIDLSAGKKYDFLLLTTQNGVNSTGYNFSAATAPENVQKVMVLTQTESSITLRWNKVNDISTYFLKYVNNSIEKVEPITTTPEEPSVTHAVTGLSAGTKYDFFLFTTHNGVDSTGFPFTAATAPRNADDFKSIGQNETSITLQWNKVNDILNYILEFNGNQYLVVSITLQWNKVNDILNYILVFNGTPRNADDFKSIGQNETSIPLQWNKVNDILNYTLVFNGQEINVTASLEDKVTYTVSGLTSGTKYDFSLFTVFENVRSSGVNLAAVTAPRNADDFKSIGRNETSITLQWNKVNDILNYTLVFNGHEINVTASQEDKVTYIVSRLTSGTKYDFSLFTVFENVRSSGVNLTAVTAPRNADDFKSIGQNETSITLQWNKVNDILNYILVFNGHEIKVTASQEDKVTYTVSGLTNGTKYDFSLFTMFENVRSSGVNLTAVTAPRNADDFKSIGQNETSITLQWNKVNDILNYILEFNGHEINVTASQGDKLTYTVSELTNGTKYDFSLFTVFENVRSSGVNLTAVTDQYLVVSITLQWNKVNDILNYILVFNGTPRNADDFKSIGQNETSITLQWNKVNDILNYILAFNGHEINVTASQEDKVTYTVSGLTSGTKYDFSLFTVFENVRSSGVNLTAVTAPRNADDFKSIGQNETSITLQWNKVNDILNYTLEFNGHEINVTASQEDKVTYTVPGLTNGTKYDFSLFTVFENVRSSGVNLAAVTAPRNADDFKSIGQNETSITLQWNKVNDILNYILVFNGHEINVTASQEDKVTYTVSGLTNGTKYDFSLFTVFEHDRSSGVNLTAVTAPRNAEDFKSIGQNETSITLQWNKVNDILNYTLAFNGHEIHVTASQKDKVTYTVSGLTNGMKYDFSLFTVFENVRSSGVNLTAVTAGSGIAGTSGTDHLAATPPVSRLNNGGTEHGPLELNVPRLPVYMVDALPEIGGPVLPNHTAPVAANVSVEVPQQNEEIPKGSTFQHPPRSPRRAVPGRAPWEKARPPGARHRAPSPGLAPGGGPSNPRYVFDVGLFELPFAWPLPLDLFAMADPTGAPRNADDFKSIGQNETSITLQWNKVNDILNYILVFNGHEIKVTASQEDKVTYTVSGLTNGTKYDFSLFTVFENVRSSGVNLNAVTAPRNAEDFKSIGQNEISITLQWNKVDDILNYILVFNGHEINVTASQNDKVTYTVLGLTNGTKYDFSLFTVFENVRSSGVNLIAVTAPRNVEDFKSIGQNETSITLQWNKVNDILNYILVFNGSEIRVTPSVEDKVTYTVPGLTSGTKYDFSLFTVFENVRSSGVNLTAVTAPADVKARCENVAAGYSILIVFDKPKGLWTEVEVNVTGKTEKYDNETQKIIIPGFQPAKSYEVSIALLSEKVMSCTPYVFQCQTDPRGVIAGSVIAVLLFGVLVFLVVFILLKRPDIIRKLGPISESRFSENSEAISVAKFPDHFYHLSADENRGFSEEYEKLLPVGTEQTRKVALLPENKARNRFSNILPYDWCRVKLSTSNPTGADYINASYMPGYKNNREYIATQGPLPATVNDFWRMIWEQRVKGIVMVTNCTEGRRTKCEQYWPSDRETCLYGEMQVTNRSEQQEFNWTLREFTLKYKNTSEERTVKHFHFTSWPDHGVPQGSEVLIQFREVFRQHIKTEGTGEPTVVHCSAGVGRTGTIIALDVLLQQLEREKAVGINAFVHKMRLNRPHMVQTESQYVFLHQCIMDCLQPHEKPEENLYENVDMIYVNATALREFR
ncbi:receptor-type tyrosine-protein phosphatase H-like [Scomber japonicus]|uniref:receptor-type tyrosine-protein phosphatase H-like n=1 Tax=Scomber japonicus TaxID=13676 RepID=UPI002305227C|nr:receptor-type tyrosine-protein phosphatase H-like [Scomber japonicus]